MEKRTLGLLGLCLLAVYLWGCGGTSQHQKAIVEAIQKFSKGADTRDVQKIQRVLHEKSHQYFLAKGNLMNITQKAYLALLKEKKIGGEERALKIESIDVTGTIASAKVTMVSNKLRFDNYMTLMRIGARWKIVSNVLKLTPRKAS